MRTHRIVAFAAAVVLIAGCGSSGSGTAGSSDSTVPTTVPTTAANTPQQLAADKAAAKKMVLQLGDLPAGYKASPPDDSSDDDIPDAVIAKFALCAHIPKAEVAKLLNDPDSASDDQPSADGNFEIHSGDIEETDFESNVEFDRSEKDISGPFEILTKAPLGCWKDLFQAALTQTPVPAASFHDLKVVPLPTGAVTGQVVAFQAKIAITASFLTLPLSLDFYFVGRGRVGISLFSSWSGKPADPALDRSLLKKIVDRVDAATKA